MLINADFSRRAIVTADQHLWTSSPQAGVERVMLDRLGGEKARATSIVRYAPGSYFPAHKHPGGEEILVLSGTFSDNEGDYPAGWYLRNPPGSSHQPYSEPGAIILVKLWQMSTETQPLRINTQDAANWIKRDGRTLCPLFSAADEEVYLECLPPGSKVPGLHDKGLEMLVLKGELSHDGQVFGTGTWLRFPAGESPVATAAGSGVTLYIKSGHLARMPSQDTTSC
ncbi:MAG: cupin domain-containing protein [Gammaproteobacteria bacterium]